MLKSDEQPGGFDDVTVPTARPVVRGTRVAVDFVLELMSDGWTPQEISRHFGHIAEDDARAAGIEAADSAPVATSLSTSDPATRH